MIATFALLVIAASFFFNIGILFVCPSHRRIDYLVYSYCYELEKSTGTCFDVGLGSANLKQDALNGPAERD